MTGPMPAEAFAVERPKGFGDVRAKDDAEK